MNRPYFALSVLLTVLTSSIFCIQTAQSIEPYGPGYRTDCPLAGDEFYGCWADFYWDAGSAGRQMQPAEQSIAEVVEQVSVWDVTWWHAGRHLQPEKERSIEEAVKRVSAWDVVWWHAEQLGVCRDHRQEEIFYLSEHDPVHDAEVYGISIAACDSDLAVDPEPARQDCYAEEFWYYFDDAYFADLDRSEGRQLCELETVEAEGRQLCELETVEKGQQIKITHDGVTYVLQSWMNDIPQWMAVFSNHAAKLVARIDLVDGPQHIAGRLAQFEREAACERAAAAYGEELRQSEERPEITYTASSSSSWEQVIRGPGRNMIRDAASTLEGLGTAMLSTSQRLYQLADAN